MAMIQREKLHVTKSQFDWLNPITERRTETLAKSSLVPRRSRLGQTWTLL